MHITFIANPHAGRGRTDAFFRRFVESSSGRLNDADIRWTEGPGHATEIARDAATEADVICACGGDGTVHEVANGMMELPKPLVVVPSGSGNDFAGLFGFPTTPEELRAVIDDGMGTYVDVVDGGGRFAVNSVGLGFEALVTKKSLSIKRLRGLPLYLTAVMKALVSFDYPAMTIRIDGEEVMSGERLMVSIGNGVSAGGGFRLTPDAYPDDALLDACIVARIGRPTMLRLLPMAISGKHVDKPPVEMRRGRRFEISADRPFHVHFDGEYIGTHSEMNFEVLPGKLPVLCKRGAPARLSRPMQTILKTGS